MVRIWEFITNFNSDSIGQVSLRFLVCRGWCSIAFSRNSSGPFILYPVFDPPGDVFCTSHPQIPSSIHFPHFFFSFRPYTRLWRPSFAGDRRQTEARRPRRALFIYTANSRNIYSYYYIHEINMKIKVFFRRSRFFCFYFGSGARSSVFCTMLLI